MKQKVTDIYIPTTWETGGGTIKKDAADYLEHIHELLHDIKWALEKEDRQKINAVAVYPDNPPTYCFFTGRKSKKNCGHNCHKENKKHCRRCNY